MRNLAGVSLFLVRTDEIPFISFFLLGRNVRNIASSNRKRRKIIIIDHYYSFEYIIVPRTFFFINFIPSLLLKGAFNRYNEIYPRTG